MFGGLESGRRPVLKMAATAVAIVAAAAIGLVLVLQFTADEREREMKRWQVRLGIVADSRLAAVNEWVGDQLGEMRGLAENASLQLYMTVLYDSEDDPAAQASAEFDYLANLLTVVADRSGFATPASGPGVPANVRRVGVSGIALLDETGRIVVSSPGAPPVEGRLRAFFEITPRGEAAVSDIFLGPGGRPSMAFLAPVYALQADETASNQIATVLGVREVGDALYPLLRQPGSVDRTAEAVLVRMAENAVEYLSPLRDGTEPLKLKLAADTANLAAAFALGTPGGFGVRTDYAGNEVLVVSRALADVPWALMYKIDTAEALAESERRLNRMLIGGALIIVLVLVGGVALWYYGTSRRATQAAERFERLANRFEAQRNFMHLVTDSQPNAIVIFDPEGHYRWFNKVAREFSGLDGDDLRGKHVSAIFGPIEGRRLAAWVGECVESQDVLTRTHALEIEGDGAHIYQSDFIYLPATVEMPAGALMVSQDITSSVREREKREEVMRQLVGTLVSVVDQRDPFSANHSVRVGRVARAIATEMELDPSMIETVGVAGNLMNLGKITVPTEVLTKQGKLTDEEFRMIRDSVLVSARLVEKIDFEGPVYETLRQLQENYDGTGMPDGLKGEEIIISARIAALANAFVGMVSARAWRDGMDFDKAVELLIQDAGKKFDRRVVVALANHLDNRGGRDEWKEFGVRPKAAE